VRVLLLCRRSFEKVPYVLPIFVNASPNCQPFCALDAVCRTCRLASQNSSGLWLYAYHAGPERTPMTSRGGTRGRSQSSDGKYVNRSSGFEHGGFYAESNQRIGPRQRGQIARSEPR
jgi:hypothetical protein